jgi:hypothetical protein
MKFVIAGYGRFGRIALARLSDSFPDTQVFIIENDKEKLREEFPLGTIPIRTDAVAFLLNSDVLEMDDFVIPMVPFHLAAHYIAAKVPDISETSLPEAMAAVALNEIRVNFSNLLVSRADFLCPDNCSEPEACTVTGRIDEPLYDTLRSIRVPGFSVLVQRSYQILPGVGGYPVRDLIKLLERITPGRHLVATSCKCHGIITALEKFADGKPRGINAGLDSR